MNVDNKVSYLLRLADNALIFGHRNSEWCGHGPVLEQDIAITNISLDLIGQARNFYQYAAQILVQNGNPGTTEDSLAYLRDAHQFKNCLLAEMPKGDWATTILRQFLLSAFQFYEYDALKNCNDEQIAAIAQKALKEVAYHVKWSSEWVIRLGDGTKESNTRINKAINDLWMYAGELFLPTAFEIAAAKDGYGANLILLKEKWLHKIETVFTEATLKMPFDIFMQTGGKIGIHTEHLGFLLAEMQFLQRAYPNAQW